MNTQVTLTCQECGHREQDSVGRVLMIKIRMWNHFHQQHPELLDFFQRSVGPQHKHTTHI